MAWRTTREAAEAVAADVRTNHPGVSISVVDRSEERYVGRIAAEEEGWQVLEDNGGPMVKVWATMFFVLEARQCRVCGTEIFTEAYGEANSDLCPRHEAEARERNEIETRRRVEESRRKVEFVDRYMRNGGSAFGVD